jgi:hypothetical protein
VPKTLFTAANLSSWSGGKYGANTQSSVHFRLVNLHAAQGRGVLDDILKLMSKQDSNKSISREGKENEAAHCARRRN